MWNSISNSFAPHYLWSYVFQYIEACYGDIFLVDCPLPFCSSYCRFSSIAHLSCLAHHWLDPGVPERLSGKHLLCLWCPTSIFHQQALRILHRTRCCFSEQSNHIPLTKISDVSLQRCTTVTIFFYYYTEHFYCYNEESRITFLIVESAFYLPSYTVHSSDFSPIKESVLKIYL